MDTAAMSAPKLSTKNMKTASKMQIASSAHGRTSFMTVESSKVGTLLPPSSSVECRRCSWRDDSDPRLSSQIQAEANGNSCSNIPSRLLLMALGRDPTIMGLKTRVTEVHPSHVSNMAAVQHCCLGAQCLLFLVNGSKRTFAINHAGLVHQTSYRIFATIRLRRIRQDRRTAVH